MSSQTDRLLPVPVGLVARARRTPRSMASSVSDTNRSCMGQGGVMASAPRGGGEGPVPALEPLLERGDVLPQRLGLGRLLGPVQAAELVDLPHQDAEAVVERPPVVGELTVLLRPPACAFPVGLPLRRLLALRAVLHRADPPAPLAQDGRLVGVARVALRLV